MFKPVLKIDGVCPGLVDLVLFRGVSGMVLPGEGSYFYDGRKVSTR